MAMSMWEYDVAKAIREEKERERPKVWAYNLRKGMQLFRKDSTPLLVTNRVDDFDNGDVVITVRLQNPYTGKWSAKPVHMRVNMLARYELA